MAPTDDDDPSDDWTPRPKREDTAVDLSASDVLELDETSPTPPRGVETLAGYDLGRRDAEAAFFAKWDHLLAAERRQGAVEILHDLRDELVRQWNDQAFVDEFVRRMALKRGIKLG